MEGKARLPDLPAGLFRRQPVPHAAALQLAPALHIGEHVHQIIIHVVCLQPAQFLGKIVLQILGPAHQILGQLGGDVHLVPHTRAVQNFSQRGLVARVNVCGVKIIDPRVNGGQHLLFGLVQVDARALAGEPHTAIAQNGQWFAVFVGSCLHGGLLYRQKTQQPPLGQVTVVQGKT